tara:strand:- start:638 stop:1156 length:519 start_codon:yes stop_codon:yes gene_type:complete
MPNYSNSKIYKIEPIVEHQEGDIYYGATTQDLSKRMSKHKSRPLCMCKNLFEKYGVDNCKIILIETCDFKTKEELNLRETYYIQNNKCVNKYISYQTQQGTKDKRDEYYKKNKDYYSKKNKDWIDKNKDRHKQLQSLNYLKNKEKMRQKYLENKEDILLKAKNRYEYRKNNL